MKYFATFLIGFAICFVVPWQSVAATGSTLEIRVLPLECVFETVNDGSNQIIFVTPAECGEHTGPPFGPVGNPGQGQPPESSPGQGHGPPVPIGNNNQGQGGQNRGQNVPMRVTPGISSAIPPRVELHDMPIYLDDYPEARSSSGVRYILPLGEVVYFSVAVDDATEEHSITIKEINSDHVIITIASTPFDARLVVGQVRSFDVSGNGQDDIEVTLRSIADGMADITFRYIASSASDGSPNLDNEESTSESATVYPTRLTFVLLVVILGVTATLVLLLRRR